MNPIPDYKNPSLSVEQRVDDLLARMTVEEKVAQLHRTFWEELDFLGEDVGFLDAEGNLSSTQAMKQLEHGICGMGRPSLKRTPRQAAVLTNAIQRYLLEHTRLGIPAFFNEEALHGLMAYRATSFPQAIALASTWNPELVEQIFTAAAHETRTRGSNYVFTPVLDLAREPRWGRTEETYGEDPYLVSRMGAAAVRGLQGRGPAIDKQHVIATAKHYTAHGQPEGGTNCAPANFSERILREQFLPPFQAAIVEAGAGSVMASYNEIDGIPSHVNTWLLQDILRQEWGFRGFVTSDGGGVDQLIHMHHVAADHAEAARKALEAGIDIELGRCFATLIEQVQAGRVAEATLDAAVKRVLRAKFLLSLFDDPYVDPDEAERVNNSPAHRSLALQAARQALVLLKNAGDMLPLDIDKLKTMAVIGPNATELHLGGYSYDPGQGVTILDGIQARVGDKVQVLYAEGCRINEGRRDWRAWWVDDVIPPDPTEDAARITEAARIARLADVALLVLGENEATCREGWSQDHLGDRDTLALPGNQDALVRAVLETGTPIVILLINGRPLSIPSIVECVPAILEGWYLGQEGGTAAAEVLFGDVNPSGKLPVTFPRTVGQLPVYHYQKPSAKRGFLFSDNTPLFPFGHGLSYTTFGYQNLRLEPRQIGVGGKAQVSVEVTNTGTRAGEEVVQLYLRDRVSSVTRPIRELKGFSRLSLQPGETRSVSFTLTPDDLSFLDVHMQRVVEPGLFDVMVGGSSAQLESVTLEVVSLPD
jgi:beta-glucosidase